MEVDSPARETLSGIRTMTIEAYADTILPGETGLSGRAWLADAVDPLGEDDRPAARLALLAAAGSHLVTDTLVTDFLARGHDDRALVEVTAWGSMAAARGVGDRLRRELTGTSLG